MFTATRCGRSQRRWMPTYKTCRRPCPTCTKTAWSARRSWAAPTSLASATVSAYAGITQLVNDLIAAHPAVVDRINQSANAYNDAESSNTAAAQGAGQGSGGSGSAPQGGYGGPAPLSQGGGTGAISGSGGGRGSLAGFSPAPSGGRISAGKPETGPASGQPARPCPAASRGVGRCHRAESTRPNQAVARHRP